MSAALAVNSGSVLTHQLRCLAKHMPSFRSTRQTACTDRKSTRLNSTHVAISYAVSCSKKKRIEHRHHLLVCVAPDPAHPVAGVTELAIVFKTSLFPFRSFCTHHLQYLSDCLSRGLHCE